MHNNKQEAPIQPYRSLHTKPLVEVTSLVRAMFQSTEEEAHDTVPWLQYTIGKCSQLAVQTLRPRGH